MDNNLLSQFPDIAKEWDYEKNDKSPEEYAPRSNKKVWWLCPRGHSYNSVINNRTSAGATCPYCANKRVLEGYNDLATWCRNNGKEEIINEWDFEKNNEQLSPQSVLACSHKSVYWKCNSGHSWKTAIRDRIKSGGCPYCSGKRIVAGYNDFATKHPDLLDEWNYEKNSVAPQEIASSSNAKVWWKCSVCGHEWQAQIGNRARGSECPICSEKKRAENSRIASYEKSLAVLYPELLKEWDYKQNKNFDPKTINPGSEQKVYWKCKKCGNSYIAGIGSRTSGTACPICAGKIIVAGTNDLQTWCNETGKKYILDEWDYQKNKILPSEIAPFANKKIWFICKMGHSYQATLANRTHNSTGCPECEKKSRTSFPEQALYYYLKKYYPDTINSYHSEWLGKLELDIYIPSKQVAIEYDGVRWHKSKDRDLYKNRLCKINNVQLIRVREKGLPELDGCINVSADVKKQKYIDFLIKEVFYVIGENIKDINVDRDTTKIIEQFDVSLKENSIAALYPELLKEWDYEANGSVLPEYVNYGSVRKYWWKCSSCGNRWLMTPNARTNQKQDCPKCSAVKKGQSLKMYHVTTNGSLLDNCPTVLDEWDNEKNIVSPSEISKGSKIKVWWKCSRCGGSYQAPVYSKTKEKPMGCPYCCGSQVLKGFNDLETVNPSLLKDWDYNKNGQIGLFPNSVTAGSNIKAFWKCHTCQNEWQARIGGRNRGRGCPICARKKVSDGHRRKVLCIEENKMFDSIKSAAEWANISSGTLVSCLKRGAKTAGGYCWKYLD